MRILQRLALKIVKESKASFFLHCAQCFAYPSPFSILFPSSIFLFRSPQFIIFPPQCFYSLLHNFIIFPPQCFLFPSSTSIFISHLHLLISTAFSPPQPPPHFYSFPSSFSTTTTTTSSSFLLFSLEKNKRPKSDHHI